eukprot:symbB.v1.2.020875.t1/scaffold1773.1/size149029/4
MGLGWQVPPAGPQAMAAAGPISVTPGAYSNPSQGLGVFTGNEISSISITPSKVVAGTKNNKQTRKKDDEANYTTIMLRNIPNKYSRQMLIDQLHSAGFLGQIDYLHESLGRGISSIDGGEKVGVVPSDQNSNALNLEDHPV